jgi:thiamine-monophosphate kinase
VVLLMSIKDEFEFIKSITPKQGLSKDVLVGIGDDAAVVRQYQGTDLIACTDTMVEGVHFKRETMSPLHIGYKALAANISDVAAMGGISSFYLVSVVVPKSWSESELIDIYKGMDTLAVQNDMVLIGGDTVSTKGPLVVNVTVLGRVEQGKCLKRSDAKPGDIVFITGTVGDSAAGLHILLSEKTNNESFHYLINRHRIPTPQSEAGGILNSFHRVSANDISDGVASEAREIAEASHVDLVINECLIPLSSEIMMFGREQAIKWALYGGEDYELIGTTSPDQWEEIKQKFKEAKLSISMVGEVHKGSGKVLLKTPEQVLELEKQGYNHFKHGDEDDNK